MCHTHTSLSWCSVVSFVDPLPEPLWSGGKLSFKLAIILELQARSLLRLRWMTLYLHSTPTLQAQSFLVRIVEFARYA